MQKITLSTKLFVKSKKVVNFTRNEKNLVSTPKRTHTLQNEAIKSEENVVINVKNSFFKEPIETKNSRWRTPPSTKPSLVHRVVKSRRGRWRKVKRAVFLRSKLNSANNFMPDKSLKFRIIFQSFSFKTSYKYSVSYAIRKRLLESNDIETNPGPNCKNVDVITYNVNGLKDY